MCHIIDRDEQLRIIESAKDDFDEVYAILERNRENRDELVGIIGVMNGTLAFLQSIGDDGERSTDDHALYKHGMSRRTLSNRFNLTSLNRLVAF